MVGHKINISYILKGNAVNPALSLFIHFAQTTVSCSLIRFNRVRVSPNPKIWQTGEVETVHLVKSTKLHVKVT